MQDNEIPISERNANSEADEDEEDEQGISMHTSGDNYLRGSVTPRNNSGLFDSVVSNELRFGSLTPVQHRNDVNYSQRQPTSESDTRSSVVLR